MFINRSRSLNVPSVRMERSWKRKKIPGFRCSSFNRAAFAERGPTSVRVYECRGKDTVIDDDSRFDEPEAFSELDEEGGGGGGIDEDGKAPNESVSSSSASIPSSFSDAQGAVVGICGSLFSMAVR